MRPVHRGSRLRDGTLRGVQPDRAGRHRRAEMDCRPSQPWKKAGGAMKKNTVHWIVLALFTLAPAAVLAQQAAPVKAEDAKKTEEPKNEDSKLAPVPGGKGLGMSILGNQEAPKALVIVPWKSSEL